MAVSWVIWIDSNHSIIVIKCTFENLEVGEAGYVGKALLMGRYGHRFPQNSDIVRPMLFFINAMLPWSSYVAFLCRFA